MTYSKYLCVATALMCLFSCQQDPSIPMVAKGSPIFQLTDNGNTGFVFSNTLSEDRLVNTMSFDGLMMGSGVGILDVNNDGLPDIYMASGQLPDKLFLNNGNFKFEDISSNAGLVHDQSWSQGVTIGDFNNDGYDDIYISKGLRDEEAQRKNVLYINQKNNSFTEEAEAYGIADTGYGVTANLFDYDMDGDLDLYVGNQPPNSTYMKQQLGSGQHFQYTDNLYRNDGSKFTNVTDQAGIKNYSYTLSVSVADYNKDGLPDIYVASDYEEPDYFYMNQGNGTFKNTVHESMRHISNFAMGADIADINRDGWLDIFTADMAAEDNYRNKTNMSGMNPEKFWMLANNGYHHQYMFNSMQINNGNGTYSEIAQMAGISNSDWSWAPLFLDADLDGYDDLYITNGQMKDVRNKDFEKNRTESIAEYKDKKMDGYSILFEISKKIPSQKIPNYMYRNKGDLTFEKKATEWGLDTPSWSQGAAYADLDLDGDLDLVVNNLSMPSFLYKNTSKDQQLGNYINIKLKGQPKNKFGSQAKVTARVNGQNFYSEMTTIRGYMSSCEPIVQFGLGASDLIDDLEIIWSDQKVSSFLNVKVNQTLEVDYSSAKKTKSKKVKEKALLTFAKAEISHTENDFDDYEREILIPHKMSTLGPDVVSGDLDGDGMDDLFICGSSGNPSQLFIQQSNGKFKSVQSNLFKKDAISEDVRAVFFDADQDADLDLYVVCGGNEWDKGDSKYQDRLYINNGKGGFKKGVLPKITTSGSVALPFDFDGDDDLDLFIGGRQVPGFYGFSESSLLLENENGTFRDITAAKGSVFKNLGMVTDAVWLTEKGKGQLVIAGEWMPIQFFNYDQKTFTKSSEIANSSGWWNDIEVADLDRDGDDDLVLGNLGTNLKFKATADKPFKVYLNDFDDNGTHDVYLGYYSADGKLFPVRGRQCSSEQMPFVKQKFESYSEFGNATIDEILDGRMEGAVEKQVETFESAVAWNNGSGKFILMSLPNEAQIAPINSSIVADFNNDGHLDILSVGNNYNREIETTRSDAGIGSLLLGDGKGHFSPLKPLESGLNSFLDARKVVKVKTKTGNKIFVANNNGPMDEYTVNGELLD